MAKSGGIEVICAYCGKPTRTKPCNIRMSKTGRFYCNNECRKRGTLQDTGNPAMIVKCPHCKTETISHAKYVVRCRKCRKQFSIMKDRSRIIRILSEVDKEVVATYA